MCALPWLNLVWPEADEAMAQDDGLSTLLESDLLFDRVLTCWDEMYRTPVRKEYRQTEYDDAPAARALRPSGPRSCHSCSEVVQIVNSG